MREATKAADERKQASLELEHANLLLNLRLQKEARNNPQGEGSASTSHAASEFLAPISLHKFIPTFDPRRDELDAYLQRFQRVALA